VTVDETELEEGDTASPVPVDRAETDMPGDTADGGGEERARDDPSGDGPPPWRLRDLSRGARIVAVVAGLLLLVPVGASVARARSVGYVPSGDDALIVLRAYDVFSSDAPLVGQPSTADAYAPGVAARHPGPIEFYALSVPVRLFGPAWGTLLTSAVVAAASVMIAAWVALRRAGPAVGLGAVVTLAFVMWSSGTAVLSDPISSNHGGYPLIAGSALAWALWCDDRRLWPLAAAVWSYTIQQHLAIFGAAGMIAAWGVAGAVTTTSRHREEIGRLKSAAKWGAASAAVAVVCWVPPLLDQLTGTGNLAKIFRFSGDEGRPTLGLRPALNAAARSIAAPPIIMTRRLADRAAAGWYLIGDLDTGEKLGTAAALAAIMIVVGLALVNRRSDASATARLALLATGGVLLVAGIVTTTQVPDSVESSRINFFRWVWPTCAAVWGAIAWAVGVRLEPLVGHLPSRQRPTERPRLAPIATAVSLVVVAVTVTATASTKDIGDTRRDEVLFRFDERAGQAVVDAVPEGKPVRLLTSGAAAFLSVGPAVAVALTDAGFDVRVDEYQEPGYGEHRTDTRSEDETIVHVLSAPGEVPAGPGQVVAGETLPLEPGGRPEVWGDAVYEIRVQPAAEQGG
jgi:hypothetical protein